MKSSRNTKKTKEEEEVEKIKERLKKKAEQLVLENFPKKIRELEELINSELFQEDFKKHAVDIDIPYPEETQAKQVRKKKKGKAKVDQNSDVNKKDKIRSKITGPWLFPHGEVPSNQHIFRMVEVLRPLMVDMIKDLRAIKLGISLMVPKMETRNNVSTGIQKELVELVSIVESLIFAEGDLTNSALEFSGVIKLGGMKYILKSESSNYFKIRGELVTKVARFPHSGDYRRAIQELDERFNTGLIGLLKNLHREYVTINDFVTKNLDKILIKEDEDTSAYTMMF